MLEYLIPLSGSASSTGVGGGGLWRAPVQRDNHRGESKMEGGVVDRPQLTTDHRSRPGVGLGQGQDHCLGRRGELQLLAISGPDLDAERVARLP